MMRSQSGLSDSSSQGRGPPCEWGRAAGLGDFQGCLQVVLGLRLPIPVRTFCLLARLH